ncbi:hypothetical protein ACR42D_10605 [Desulfovibrio caledoniensis]
MTLKEKQAARERVLARVMLRLFRSRETEVKMTRLAELFEMERLDVAAKFFNYTTFARWVQRVPGMTVDVVPGAHPTAWLRLDTPAAMFVGSRTGEGLHVDFAALRSRRPEPVGNFRCREVGA